MSFGSRRSQNLTWVCEPFTIPDGVVFYEELLSLKANYENRTCQILPIYRSKSVEVCNFGLSLPIPESFVKACIHWCCTEAEHGCEVKIIVRVKFDKELGQYTGFIVDGSSTYAHNHSISE
jgi:hypothetical protein